MTDQKPVNKRVYKVTHNSTGDAFLIRAQSAAQAMRHATKSRFSVCVASQDDLIELAGNTEVEDA